MKAGIFGQMDQMLFFSFFFLMSDFTRSDDSSGYFNACTKIMDLFFYFLKASLIDK